MMVSGRSLGQWPVWDWHGCPLALLSPACPLPGTLPVPNTLLPRVLWGRRGPAEQALLDSVLGFPSLLSSGYLSLSQVETLGSVSHSVKGRLEEGPCRTSEPM